jgi:hypothetical protein
MTPFTRFLFLSSLCFVAKALLVRLNRLTSSTRLHMEGYQLAKEVEKQTVKEKLYLLSARTSRGGLASDSEKGEIAYLVNSLEELNASLSPAREADGTWELIYTNTQLFRSSPLFMAARALLKTEDEAAKFNQFCALHLKALRFTRIGRVTQIVTPNTLRSEFETEVPLFPGLPIAITGTIVSTADIEFSDRNSWTLGLDTTRIKEGSSNVPILNNFLDNFTGLPLKAVGNALESRLPSYSNPKPVFRTVYLDEDLRISRDQDDHVFVYSKL